MMLTTLLFALALSPPIDAPRPFTITVVDEQTGRGVPLVELKTTNNQIFITDSNGIAALVEPGLMGEKVYFHVQSHGYEYPKDGFGYRGKALMVEPGGEAELKVKRINIAERLYRVTGGGIYRDSVLAGRDVPIEKPLLNAKVFGSDSVMNAIYKGKLHWFWGDTNRPAYPLGNFHTPGAVSLLPADGGLDPDRGVNLEYYLGPDGFAKETCKMPGEGPTWITALAVFQDDGHERLLASYAKIKGYLTAYERGFIEWDDSTKTFRKVATYPVDAPVRPDAHTFRHTIDGAEYVYFSHPLPLTRVPANPDAYLDLARYETFTCLLPGSRLDDPKLDRDASGRLHYAWRHDAPAVGPAEQRKLIEAGVLKPDEGLIQLRDAETGKVVTAHSGSVEWNPYRQRWVLIAVEIGGDTSMLGEVWYAEADTPVGPWAYARKVVTHDKYTFYNPKQHPYFSKDDGRRIYFEGTYASTFSGNPVPTPRYDYNQVMYRLDLDDPRLALPVAIRNISEGEFPNRFSSTPTDADRPIAFFAPDRSAPGLVPISVGQSQDRHLGLTGPDNDLLTVSQAPVFFALPPDTENPPKATTLLYEFLDADGRRAYSTDPDWSSPGFQRTEKPLCRVWKDPWDGKGIFPRPASLGGTDQGEEGPDNQLR